MKRSAGQIVQTTTLGEAVDAFVPHPLPPRDAARLLYSAIRKAGLLVSQIEGTQASFTDLFDEEAGLEIANADDIEEVLI